MDTPGPAPSGQAASRGQAASSRQAASYGDAFAEVYDRWYPPDDQQPDCLDRLTELWEQAGGGPVLELGVGTGRLALPLADRGLAVTGVDASAAMLTRLAAKDPARRVRPVLADMADLDASDLSSQEYGLAGSTHSSSGNHVPNWYADAAGEYGLAFVTGNTLLNLADGAAQSRCLAGVAKRLRPGGRLVIETFVPADPVAPGPDDDPQQAGLGPLVFAPSRRSLGELVWTASRHDPASQVVLGHHLQLGTAGVRLRPWRLHYLWPDQLDALATDAGLALEARWADWRRTPFGDDSPLAISIYVRPAS